MRREVGNVARVSHQAFANALARFSAVVPPPEGQIWAVTESHRSVCLFLRSTEPGRGALWAPPFLRPTGHLAPSRSGAMEQLNLIADVIRYTRGES